MKNYLFQKFLELFEGAGKDELPVREKSNLAEWLESRLHLSLTTMADELFGNGIVTRDERIVLSGAIGVALDSYHQFLVDNAPQLFDRSQYEDAPAADVGSVVSESTPSAFGTSPKFERASNLGEEETELTEGGTGMFVPLMEKAVRRDGTIPVKIIQPGWGSSGYYPAEVLERDGPKIFTKGTKMYWNHQTPQQEAERPEGDLNNLAAELVTDARYQANGAAGAGLYADAKVFEAYKSHVDDLAPHIGVSIRAMGKVQHGVAEGREGAIISELTNKKSVDFVTAPGAGGQILSLFEAARTVRADKKTTTTESVEQNNFEEARNMEKKEFEALQESVATLQTTVSTVTDENARLKEALALMGAKDVVNAALANLPLPDVTKARLLESLPRTAPMKDGVLDVETFKTKITEAVKVEVDYLTKAAGLGTIRGLGESSSGDDAEFDEAKQQGELEAAFAGMGLSESGVKIAAGGRK
jgi:hypothetical protein